MKRPRISVCIATYNGGRFIKKQLETILPQLDDNDEVIISDDSSQDNTLDIINSFNDPRISLIPDQSFKSPVYNFENALRNYSGEIIFLSDQDDLWHSQKVSIFLQHLNSYHVVISDALLIDENDNIIGESFYEINGTKKSMVSNIIRNGYLGCCMAFRKEVLDYILPFPKNLPMHDWWIGLVGETFFTTKFIDDKLISYRKHTNNVSVAGEKSNYSLITKIKFRLIILWELLKRILNKV